MPCVTQNPPLQTDVADFPVCFSDLTRLVVSSTCSVSLW